MHKYIKVGLIGVLIFFSTFFFLFFSSGGIPPPQYIIHSSIDLSNVNGFDSNNDTEIDTIRINLFNSGFRTEQLINIDFTLMDKNWNLTNSTYPFELLPVEVGDITLSAVSNNDQISSFDEIYIDFYFASAGTKPAFTLTDNDIIWQEESSFSLRNRVEIDKVYVDTQLFVESLLYYALLSLGITFLILFIYLILFKRDV